MKKLKTKLGKDKTRLKKILVLSFSFYPDDSPNTYRWKNILDVWANEGIEIHVVSAQKGQFSSYEIINGIKIYRTGKTLFQRFKSKLGKLSDDKIFNKNTNKLNKESLIRIIYNKTWKKLIWPDWAFLFYKPALKLARKIIKKEGITHLITISWPFTDHLVGYKLKQEFDLFWLAETIDPFSFNQAINNYKLYYKKSLSIEKKIMYKADSLVVMNDLIRDKYVSLFPNIKNKVNVIHNIYVPEKTDFVPQYYKNPNTIKLVFMGTLCSEVRSPDNLLLLFKKLLNQNFSKKIELHFYGKIKSNIKSFKAFEALINDRIFLHGVVPKKHVKSILEESDILINIGNSNPYQEPSKIIEYMYLGKPIINVYSIDNDSSKKLLSNYKLNFNINKFQIENQTTINEMFDFINNDFKLRKSEIDQIVSPYLLEKIQKQYLTLLV